jgi:hypothetical protein
MLESTPENFFDGEIGPGKRSANQDEDRLLNGFLEPSLRWQVDPLVLMENNYNI